MSDEFKIKGYAEGLGEIKGMLGAFLFMLPGGGYFSVSEGFSKKQRKEFWKEKTNLLGKKVKIEYQEKSADGSLKYPKFIGVVEDK
jgi:ATP-dependent DNA ligase